MGQGCCGSDATQVKQPAQSKGMPKAMAPQTTSESFEIEYFNINGRVGQLRCVAFYCSALHTNSRIKSFPEFGANKKAGKYMFGSVPVINFKNGTQMAQTQSMMRWIALSFKGKKGESLYPGKADPELSWQIDSWLENAQPWLGANFGDYMSGSPITPEKVATAVSTSWTNLLTQLEKQLSRNPNPNFIVGNNLTLADCAYGALLLKFYLADVNPHKAEYATVVEKFPKAKAYAHGTISNAFLAWFKTEPIGNFNNGI